MLLILALLAHEVSHVFSAILLNIEFSKVKITLFGINLNAHLDNVSHAKKIILFFAGPLCNLCFYFGFRNTEYFCFANMNLLLAYINLFPIVPLDGGNICKTILEIFGYKDGIRLHNYDKCFFYTFLYNYNIHIQRLFVFFAGCYGTKGDSGGKQLLA